MECTVTTKSAEEEIDPALILPNPAQPRRDFPEDELYQLADSIRRYGILQPLTVRRRYGDSGVLYELIAGERRLRAAVIAGLGRVPCRVLHISAEQSAELAIIENIQRRDLTPVFSFTSKGVYVSGKSPSSVEGISRWRNLLDKMRNEGFSPR